MPSIEQIMGEVTSIKATSDELSALTGTAGQRLVGSAQQISALVRGSASGQEAVMAVNAASRALGQAAASMAALSRTCDDALQSLAR